MSIPDLRRNTVAARISKSKSKSNNKSKSLKSKKAARTRTVHMVLGFSAIGLAGYVLGQGIEKAISYA